MKKWLGTYTALKDKKSQKWAMGMGMMLLIMAVCAGVAFGYSFSALYVSGDSLATLAQVGLHQDRALIGLIFWGIVLLQDLGVTLGSYYVLEKFSSGLARLTAFFRLAYSIFLSAGIWQLIQFQRVINQPSQALSADAVYSLLDGFNRFWSLGLIPFGIHLVLLGLALYQFKLSPLALNLLLAIGGTAYVLVHTLAQLGEGGQRLSAFIEPPLVLPMALSELLLAVWLIYLSRKPAS